MWSTLPLLFSILSATTLAEKVELTKTGGEVPLGDDVTITVANNNKDSCTFLLQLPKLCCYTVKDGGDCEGLDQSPECNAGYSVNPKDGMCVLTLTNFEATDAGTYEAEGKVIVVEAGAGSGNGLTIAVIVIIVLAGVGAAIGGGVWYNKNNGASRVPSV